MFEFYNIYCYFFIRSKSIILHSSVTIALGKRSKIFNISDFGYVPPVLFDGGSLGNMADRLRVFFRVKYSRLAANAYKKMNPSGGIDSFRKLENVVKSCMLEMNFVE